MFLLEGFPSAFFGIVAYLSLADRPANAKWLSMAEKDAIAQDLAERSRDVPAQITPHREAFRDLAVCKLAALYFALNCAAYALSFWMPSMIERAGTVGVQRIGSISIIPYACAVIAMIWYSRHSDRTQERRWHFVFAVLLGSVALSLCSWMEGLLWPSVALISVALAAVMASIPVFWAVATSALRKESAAVGIAIITSLGGVSGIICPYAMGLIKSTTGSLNDGLYACSALLIAACFVMLRMKTDPRRQGSLRSVRSGE